MTNLSTLIGAGGGGTLQAEEFTASGTFNGAAGVTSVLISMCGGGSGGEGRITGSGVGGPGATALINRIVKITAEAAITVTIGAGGAGGAAGGANPGGNGGDSSFGTLVVTPGALFAGVVGTDGGAAKGGAGGAPSNEGGACACNAGGAGPNGGGGGASYFGPGGDGGSSSAGADGGATDYGVGGGGAGGNFKGGDGGGGYLLVQWFGA